jgi:hypothetical protein
MVADTDHKHEILNNSKCGYSIYHNASRDHLLEKEGIGSINVCVPRKEKQKTSTEGAVNCLNVISAVEQTRM